MRNAFMAELEVQAHAVPEVFLAVGDLGYGVVESFARNFPDRYLNVGIAEQNMSGVAAGLAMTGFNVFTYSIANFPTLRCLEQIRNDICYHGASVKIVSVGAGLAYGSLGYSHHAVQDIACLRGFPGILMATPGDPAEAQAVTRHLCRTRGPAYLRLGKAGETRVHHQELEATYPWFPVARPGSGRTGILCCGSVLALAEPVAAASGSELRSAALWADDAPTRAAVVAMVDAVERMVVVEEHLAAGGFGSFVRECLESRPDLQSRVRVLALDPAACCEVGSQGYLRGVGHLTAEEIRKCLV